MDIVYLDRGLKMKIKYNISRFRSIIQKQEIELESEKLNIIIGTNGSGKSNILDAIRASWVIGNRQDGYSGYLNRQQIYNCGK